MEPAASLALAMVHARPSVLDSSAAPGAKDSPAPQLVFDGGCPFCRHFAQLSELRGGLPGLVIRDGRSDRKLRRELRQRGLELSRGAVLIDGERLLHGAEAIQWLCARMQPSAPLLKLLGPLLADPGRAQAVYPLLLLARRLALAARGLPVDPDHGARRT